MAKFKEYPSFEELSDAFEIDNSGCGLVWKNPQLPRYIGKKVGLTITCKGYARIHYRRRPLFLHRVLWKMWTGCEPSGEIDHINGDRLDNRRENLRIAPPGANQRNTLPRGGQSKFKGVFKDRNGRFGSRIKVNKKSIYLGSFGDEVKAARAYDEAAVRLHGAFCSTNESLGLY